MSGFAAGLMAASAALILRALSSYIVTAMRVPGRVRPTARTTSKLPRCAPIRKTPCPSASAAWTSPSPYVRRDILNRSKRPFIR